MLSKEVCLWVLMSINVYRTGKKKKKKVTVEILKSPLCFSKVGWGTFISYKNELLRTK